MTQLSLFLVVLLALLIPIFMARFHVNAVPTAVAEIVTGIIMGNSGFGLIRASNHLTFLANLGVIILMFLSGMEIDFDLLLNKKNGQKQPAQSGKMVDPLTTALTAFGGIAVMAIFLAWLLQLSGLFHEMMLATIILMTIALGVVIATLKEKDILRRPVGQTILLTAVAGEVIPLLLLTVYASLHGGGAARLWLLILLFAAAIFLLWRFRQPYEWFNQVTKATTQLDIRLAFFLIFALVTVAETVGAENILGAFLAGMVMKLLEPSEATKDKLTSIGYGFFIPIFFIMTGVNLNLRSLFAHPASLVLLPVLVVFLFLAKLPVFLIYRRKFSRRNAWAGSFLTATTITIVLPTLQVARRLNAITSTQSAAFVLAAVIVCVGSPIIFNAGFVLTKADRIKQRVVIIGANTFTMPVIHDLHDNWYAVRVLTADEEAYRTFKSRANLSLLPDYSEEELKKAGAFAGDILVSACHDDQINEQIAKIAKQNGVGRVIVRLHQPTAQTVTRLHERGCEIFNFTNVRAALMRALIESPAVYQVLTATKNILYSVKVTNTAYTDRPLRDWDFIDQITVSRIKRQGEWLAPHGSTVIEEGDVLVFSGEFKDVDRVRSLLQA